MKGRASVAKSLLNGWRMGFKVLRAEAPYLPAHEPRLIALANKLEMIFDLVLLDESVDDRIPGQPRAF